MKIVGDTTCPNCKKKHEVELDVDKLDSAKIIKENPQISNPQASGLQTQQVVKPQEKIIEKEVIKSVPSSDQPYYECKDCDNMHKNPNYKIKPNQKCSNCGSLNRPKAKGCKNCGNTEFEEVDNDELNELGVPEPELVEHDHEPAE